MGPTIRVNKPVKWQNTTVTEFVRDSASTANYCLKYAALIIDSSIICYYGACCHSFLVVENEISIEIKKNLGFDSFPSLK